MKNNLDIKTTLITLLMASRNAKDVLKMSDNDLEESLKKDYKNHLKAYEKIAKSYENLLSKGGNVLRTAFRVRTKSEVQEYLLKLMNEKELTKSFVGKLLFEMQEKRESREILHRINQKYVSKFDRVLKKCDRTEIEDMATILEVPIEEVWIEVLM